MSILTAEQVMAVAGKHQPDYCSDTHVCFDWQAIADELNAALECDDCCDKNGFDESLGFECTSCETIVRSYMQTTTSDRLEQFNYCPNCGRKVVKP